MDRSVRELGAGDMGVPRRVKVMAKSFFGRAEAYREAAMSGDRDALAAAIARNVFPDDDGVRPAAIALADYSLAALSSTREAAGALLRGEIAFPSPADFAPASLTP
jgi:cytochrome b pre-mRNA-processing protein 3